MKGVGFRGHQGEEAVWGFSVFARFKTRAFVTGTIYGVVDRVILVYRDYQGRYCWVSRRPR